MQSIHMANHFKELYGQRRAYELEIERFRDMEWKQPFADKWSIGESHYHLYLMMRRFRQLNIFYVPLFKPVAAVRARNPYPIYSQDIYTEYKGKRKMAMPAPFILIPPKGVADTIAFADLTEKLDEETGRLEKMLSAVGDDIAGHIRFPDPLAHYPNLIQSIHLLSIHEKHHFSLCLRYYKGSM